MWRVPGAPKTGYSVPPGASEKNRARAAKAHFGPWWQKALTFPAFKRFGSIALDASAITERTAQCKPFSWYLQRFGHIYRDAGLLPSSIYQLESLEHPGALLALNLALSPHLI